jgi:hypothetical protein
MIATLNETNIMVGHSLSEALVEGKQAAFNSSEYPQQGWNAIMASHYAYFAYIRGEMAKPGVIEGNVMDFTTWSKHRAGEINAGPPLSNKKLKSSMVELMPVLRTRDNPSPLRASSSSPMFDWDDNIDPEVKLPKNWEILFWEELNNA